MPKRGLVDQIATAAIETTINTLIKDNLEHEQRLNRLKGQVLQVHLIELKKTFTFIFSQQVDVLANYEGSPDCYLSLHLAALPQLKDQNNITQLIKQEKIELEGELQLAQKFSQLMNDSKPDIEEWLSKVTGDVVAHSVVHGIKETNNWFKKQISKHQNHIGQVLTEEWKIMPGSLEVAHFCDQVSEVKMDFDTLEKRLVHLLEKA